MMKKITAIISIIFLLNFSAAFAQTSTRVTSKDLQLFIGEWKGTLTYLDYTSHKPYTMPADVNIIQLKNSNVFILSNLYPDEPKANSADTLIISEDGKMINNETVKSNQKLDNGEAKIITGFLGKDGNDHLPAQIRITYTIGKNLFTNIKEVQFVGQNEWIKRHEYSYTRK